MATNIEDVRIASPTPPARRVWIIDDEAQERAWLRAALRWAAKAADWPEPVEIREANSGEAWIETVSADGYLGPGDFIVADGMIGDNPLGGATLVRTWLDNRFPTRTKVDQPRLLMLTGQGFDVMRRAFAVGTYAAVSLAKPDDRRNQESSLIYRFPEWASAGISARRTRSVSVSYSLVFFRPHALRFRRFSRSSMAFSANSANFRRNFPVHVDRQSSAG